jgi:hypothetical protein
MWMSEITIELGNHPADARDQDAVFKKTRQGNDSSHFWPSAVKHRMAKYKPSVIAIDSAQPVYPTHGKVPYEDKANIWTLLPGKPSEINDTEQIFVVAGDNTYAESDANTYELVGLRMLSRAGFAYVGYKALSGAYKLSRSDIPLPEDPTEDDYSARRNLRKRQMTRGHFLGMMGGLAGFAVGLSGQLSADLPRGIFHDVTGEVGAEADELTLDRVLNPNDSFSYADGRTALLIAKLKDVIGKKDFGLTGAVVLGEAHNAHSQELLNDGALRDAFIRRHAELVIKKARTDNDYYSDSKAREQLRYERKIQIYEVTEPDDKAFSADPKKEISRMVTMVDEFKSPSVITATSGVLKIPAN